MLLFKISLITLLFFCNVNADIVKPYHIGVLAYKGKQSAIKRWSGHEEYLNKALYPLKFQIIPLSYKQDEFTLAVQNHKVDFVITNPGHYTELELDGLVTHLATRRMEGPKGVLDQFGGTAITQSDKHDINTYADLENKQILIPSFSSLGGWQVHLREAIRQGVDLRKQATIVQLKNHKKVVQAIIAGKADAGFIRSDLIEELVEQKIISFDQLKIINQQQNDNYPYLLSTELYPEWPFGRVNHTSRELSTKVVQALLQMQPGDQSAIQAKIHGWTIPGQYSSVNDLFRETELGPYEKKALSFKEILSLYWWESFIGLLILAIILLITVSKTHRTNLALVKEIRNRKKAEDKLITLSQAIEQSPISVIITDKQGDIEFVNSAFEKNTGYRHDEVEGKNTRILQSGLTQNSQYQSLWQTIISGNLWEGELQNKKKNGELYWEYCYIAPVLDEQKQIKNFLAVKENITERKAQEELIKYQAHYDSLTALPNRYLCLERLNNCIHKVDQNNSALAIMFIDMDNFKKVNDTLGHSVGDVLLIDIARRLEIVTPKDYTIGRLGGDEFIVIMDNEAQTTQLAQKILSQFKKSFIIDNRELTVTASIGIAYYPAHGNTPDILLQNSDTAMYHAKSLGKNTYAEFDEIMNQKILRKLEIEEQFNVAIAREEFSVHYQPKVDILNKRLMGAEALVRWNNHKLGFVSPDEFIAIAEDTDFIQELGYYVLETSIKQAAKWQTQYDIPFRIAVNLSPSQFKDTNLIDKIIALIETHQLMPGTLEVEITEGLLLSGVDNVDSILNQLEEHQIVIALDDFGTGFSSLGYLNSYPFNVLKIDKSFIDKMEKSSSSKELVNAIILMAHSLDLKVVAEGVENKQQLEHLHTRMCDCIQGYYFSKPIPADKFDLILSDTKWPESALS